MYPATKDPSLNDLKNIALGLLCFGAVAGGIYGLAEAGVIDKPDAPEEYIVACNPVSHYEVPRSSRMQRRQAHGQWQTIFQTENGKKLENYFNQYAGKTMEHEREINQVLKNRIPGVNYYCLVQEPLTVGHYPNIMAVSNTPSSFKPK